MQTKFNPTKEGGMVVFFVLLAAPLLWGGVAILAGLFRLGKTALPIVGAGFTLFTVLSRYAGEGFIDWGSALVVGMLVGALGGLLGFAVGYNWRQAQKQAKK